jgi:hypothetical protein
MEQVEVAGSISGADVISDLLDRIGDKLSKSCDLRPVDVYRGYAAKVEVQLQLMDIYPVAVTQEIQVGALDPAQPSKHIALGSEIEAKLEQACLERPIDPAGVTEAPAREKRIYVSRIRAAK